MKIRSLFYHIKDGLKNIYRNRLFSLASIATIAAFLFACNKLSVYDT